MARRRPCHRRPASIAILVGMLLAGVGSAQPAAATARIAYARGGDIFTVHTDGSGIRRVTDGPSYEHMPTWSPDHRRLAFVVWRRTVVSVRADGSGRRVLVRLPSRFEGITGLAWSPDGARLAIATARELGGGHVLGPKDCGQIWWIDAPGGPRHVVLRWEPHITGISWSPDGKWLAVGFEHQNMTRSCGDDRPMGIARVRIDGSGLRSLGPELATSPDWSPDGRWIVYRDWRRTCHICGEVWVVRPDGSRNHVLTPVPASEGGLHQPRYAPGGRRLVALGDGIWLLDADGTILRRVVARADSIDW